MSHSPSSRRATLGYVVPFAAYLCLLQLERAASLSLQLSYPVRLAVVILILLTLSRPYIPLRPSVPWLSVGVGAGVFLIWIGPDVLFHYRHHWLFENRLMGEAVSSIPPELQAPWIVAIRTLSSVAAVPILEELFWRGWMMRWLIHVDFLKVPIGTYSRWAFWIVAIFFASEHGPYWEVGLLAGIVYNWWLIRTKNLADCILAHAVTNALLAVYVLAAGQWQYWL